MESANDQTWGTGMTLGNPDCLVRDKWISQGILGELLEEVRSQQLHQPQPAAAASMSMPVPPTNNAIEPIAKKMLSIANYPQPGPPLQPPPVPESILYMPNIPNVAWPPGLVPTSNTYPYVYPQPRYPGIQMQPMPPPVTTNTTQPIQPMPPALINTAQHTQSQPPSHMDSATSNPEEISMESS